MLSQTLSAFLARQWSLTGITVNSLVGYNLRRAKCQHSSVATIVSGCAVDDHFSWMKKYSRKYPVNGNNVQIISSPSEFYDILLEKAKTAEKRIVLASLYLGTGKLERSFVKCVEDRVGSQKDKLQVRVLLDYTRGSRGPVSSREMLTPLLQQQEQGQSTVNVSLYHSPELRGMRKRLLPEKWNELVGLQHIKAYIFDDDIIISGANLSNDYFTNRQDRYVLLKNVPDVADFYEELIEAVASFSFQLQPDNTVILPSDLGCHPYKDMDFGKKFKAVAKKRIESVLTTGTSGNSSSQTNSQSVASAQSQCDNIESSPAQNVESTPDPCAADTYVYPLVQMGPFSIDTDRLATLEFLRKCPGGSKLVMASGYFNLIQEYVDVILNRCQASMAIYTASPLANGFFNGQPPLHHIPSVYTHISKGFLERVRRTGQQHRIGLYEYSRPQWTFHAKGLWYYMPGHAAPSATFVGSPNFGHRSVHRDLESQILITTTNENLKKKLHEEQQRLLESSYQVTEETFAQPERKVPWYVQLAAKLGRSFI